MYDKNELSFNIDNSEYYTISRDGEFMFYSLKLQKKLKSNSSKVKLFTIFVKNSKICFIKNYFKSILEVEILNDDIETNHTSSIVMIHSSDMNSLCKGVSFIKISYPNIIENIYIRIDFNSQINSNISPNSKSLNNINNSNSNETPTIVNRHFNLFRRNTENNDNDNENRNNTATNTNSSLNNKSFLQHKRSSDTKISNPTSLNNPISLGKNLISNNNRFNSTNDDINKMSRRINKKYNYDYSNYNGLSLTKNNTVGYKTDTIKNNENVNSIENNKLFLKEEDNYLNNESIYNVVDNKIPNTSNLSNKQPPILNTNDQSKLSINSNIYLSKDNDECSTSSTHKRESGVRKFKENDYFISKDKEEDELVNQISNYKKYKRLKRMVLPSMIKDQLENINTFISMFKRRSEGTAFTKDNNAYYKSSTSKIKLFQENKNNSLKNQNNSDIENETENNDTSDTHNIIIEKWKINYDKNSITENYYNNSNNNNSGHKRMLKTKTLSYKERYYQINSPQDENKNDDNNDISKNQINLQISNNKQQNECNICLEDIKNKSTLKPCNHSFCNKCITHWAKNSTFCPLCKKQFKTIISKKSAVTYNKAKPFKFEENDEDELNWYRNLLPYCMICKGVQEDYNMLVCESCNRNVCHYYCDNLKDLPPMEEVWNCSDCRSGVKQVLPNIQSNNINHTNTRNNNISNSLTNINDRKNSKTSQKNNNITDKHPNVNNHNSKYNNNKIKDEYNEVAGKRNKRSLKKFGNFKRKSKEKHNPLKRRPSIVIRRSDRLLRKKSQKNRILKYKNK